MSATLSSVEQKVYKKVMASKKKAMTQLQIETAIPGLSKKDCHTAINKILGLKLFTASKNSKSELVFHGVAVEDARKQNTLTTEQQYVLSIVDKAGNTGISKQSIANQVNTEIMARMQVFRALESLEKVGLVKTFKSVNAPTMPLYILAHLKPPEDMAGGIWFDESKEYDSVFVDTLRGVVLNFIQQKRKGRDDAISKLCSNPIYPISKTAVLPTPAVILAHLQKNRVTSAPLTVKNVMEICRALELDGLIEAIKPIGGVRLEPMFDNSDSDEEPVTKRSRRSKGDDDDDDIDPEERERRQRKDREKMKAKLKEAKREKERKERAREREKQRKEKEKEKKRREKDREKKRKAREKERARKEKEKRKKKRVLSTDLDDSDEELREVDEPKKRPKKRVLSDESDVTSDSSSGSDTESDSDSDSDVSVSSVDSDDLDNGTIALKPQSTAASMINLANPFFSDTGRQTLIDLSDQAVLYRALQRLTISLGQTQAPCGTCPQFNFCEEGGPVNADSCSYFTDWLSGTGGGWTADVKAEKAKAKAEEEQERRRAAAAANGEAYVEEPMANGEEVYEEDEEYDDYDAPMGEEGIY